MNKYVLIDAATGTIRTVMRYDGSGDFTPPAGYTLHVVPESFVGSPGDHYDSRTGAVTAQVPEQTRQLEGAVEANRRTLVDNARAALSTCQDIIDAPEPSFTDLNSARTQIGVLQDQVQDLARITRGVLRLVGAKLDGTD